MQGKIVKGIAGFYYIHIPERGVYECKAKGIFRKEHTKPLVGDNVIMEVLQEETRTGNVTRILPRTNELIRPAVANIDQAMVIFSLARPEPNLNLLDRFLISMEKQNIPCVICFNKQDIVTEEEQKSMQAVYAASGYPIIFTSAVHGEGMEEVRAVLAGKTTTLAGPSGVGKSSMVNAIAENVSMETGSISEKIGRGKHTTRHSELIAIAADTYIMDTPGFSSLRVADLEKEEISGYYPEFTPYEETCRFQGCAHIHEPDCGVKQAVEEGNISRIRYENYLLLYQECKEKRRY